MRPDFSLLAALAALAVLAHPGDAQATARKPRAEPPAGFATAAPGRAAKPPAVLPPAMRADKPLVTATAPGAGQAGYVHYFLIRLPDDALEIQVGIELPDQRIAWSFPGLGAVISPFIEAGTVTAGGEDYDVWHLYAIRPFPDDAAMGALQKQLAGRVRPWVEAKTPYCENDGPRAGCMSCLGFVLRALFPARADGYPALPRDFARAGTAARYTTKDLLLYLTGMLELPTRQARLQRIARLELPDDLREDLENLVQAMGAGTAAPGTAAQKRPVARPTTIGTRPARRAPL
jgi:hypothetical protein